MNRYEVPRLRPVEVSANHAPHEKTLANQIGAGERTIRIVVLRTHHEFAGWDYDHFGTIEAVAE
jgi:hypothetical protein